MTLRREGLSSSARQKSDGSLISMDLTHLTEMMGRKGCDAIRSTLGVHTEAQKRMKPRGERRDSVNGSGEEANINGHRMRFSLESR